ncbi:RHS repeat-associated core domain-containing protein [Roseateles sp. SL47]|uniref:RHS repeat-associated core domain-containing protein n=1 Tax=Roseateles sp. SL47 TaxID=2995138 RepID=UPI00226FC580|nr:RHS repeat-associated core domain-containing protein [Roseateles sp. SL47]WAC74282.1 RHS repeat-associated core domain-containing protein [Roseateles sp. SL47]
MFFSYADHLGAPRILVDRTGAERWRWGAEPFGATAADPAPSGLAAVAFPLRFPGQYFDAETGLNYNYFRDYDGTSGRYVQSDPIGLVGGINTYAYVEGNPLSYADPNGLQAITGNDVGVALPAVGSVCAATGGTACAAAVVGAVGVASYWLTDRYVNPWAQPMIASAIEWCTASDTPTQQECDAEWLRARNVCFEWMNELGRPGISARRRRILLELTGGNMAICMSGQVSQACGGTKVEQPPKPRRKRYL